MLGLGNVIKNKSTAGLPFPMIFTGFFVGLSWLLYGKNHSFFFIEIANYLRIHLSVFEGICLGNIIVIAQNLVAFVLSAFQLSLFVIYPSKPVVKNIKKKN